MEKGTPWRSAVERTTYEPSEGSKKASSVPTRASSGAAATSFASSSSDSVVLRKKGYVSAVGGGGPGRLGDGIEGSAALGVQADAGVGAAWAPASVVGAARSWQAARATTTGSTAQRGMSRVLVDCARIGTTAGRE